VGEFLETFGNVTNISFHFFSLRDDFWTQILSRLRVEESLETFGNITNVPFHFFI
jgi:hypothetical protein